MHIGGAGITDDMLGALHAAVSLTLATHGDFETLSLVLTRSVGGEWTVFVTDGMNLEVVDGELTARIVRALKGTERRMGDKFSADDRRLLEVIARVHGHGPRRPIALLDIAWAETGSEEQGRSALQRLVLLGYVQLEPGRATREFLGKLTDKGAAVLAAS